MTEFALKTLIADLNMVADKIAVGSRREPEHVLFLIDRFPERMGGAEGALLRTIRLLPADRYRCSVATFAVDPRFGDIRHLFSCPFHVFPLKRTYDWNALQVAIKMARLIRSERVSLVHTFFSTSDLWGGMIAKLSGCPVLISSRRDMGVFRSVKHEVAYRVLAGMFDQVQAVSDHVRSFSISKDGLAPNRVVTLHTGVDLAEIEGANGIGRDNPTLGLQDASHVVITVGNIRPIKGTDVLVRTAARVCKRFPKAVFLVVGGVQDQSYFRSVQELTSSYGLTNNVRFLGLRYDVPSILKIGDVFCQTSRSEGLPNSLLEAMACKLPCVATDVGGTGEIINHGESGFLFPSEDPQSAAEHIISLLCDRKRAAAMGKVGRRIVEEKFTVQSMVDRMIGYYDRALEETRARSTRS